MTFDHAHDQIVPKEEIQRMWEGFSDLERAAVDHSARQQIDRFSRCVPEIMRDSLRQSVSLERYRDTIVSDIYQGKVSIDTYTNDYKQQLEASRGIGSNDSGIGIGGSGKPARTTQEQAAG